MLVFHISVISEPYYHDSLKIHLGSIWHTKKNSKQIEVSKYILKHFKDQLQDDLAFPELFKILCMCVKKLSVEKKQAEKVLLPTCFIEEKLN